MGGDLAPSLRDGKKFRGPNFPNDLFLWKKIHFTAENCFFCLLPGLCCLTSDTCITNMTTFLQKNVYFRQNISSLTNFFLICSYFATLPITLLLQILGYGCMGRPPSSKSPPMYADADKRIRRDRDTTMETYFSNSFYIALQTEPLSVIDHRLNLAWFQLR